MALVCNRLAYGINIHMYYFTLISARTFINCSVFMWFRLNTTYIGYKASYLLKILYNFLCMFAKRETRQTFDQLNQWNDLLHKFVFFSFYLVLILFLETFFRLMVHYSVTVERELIRRNYKHSLRIQVKLALRTRNPTVASLLTDSICIVQEHVTQLVLLS